VNGWRAQAACRGHPSPWWWYSADPLAVALARRVCSSCPVAADCLADALEVEAGTSPVYWAGVRGGLTPLQRARQQRVAHHLH
jgi:hypothetical protein